MDEQSKQGLKRFLTGLFTGIGIATPITAFITKKICDKKSAEAIEKAKTASFSAGEDAGMNAMAEYVVQQQGQSITQGDTDGDVAPELEDIPSAEEINNYDLHIDDEEATEEARERTESHERYLDMIERYGEADLKPYMIDGDQYINDQYMQKSYVNWYDQDDVFEEDLNVIEDPYQTFGVTSGKDLFEHAEERFDPDICYVRNEKMTTDFEITRVHGAYAIMVGGERELGETNQKRRTD